MDFNTIADDLTIFYLESKGLQEADYTGKYAIANAGDGSDSYISKWDLAIPQPTTDELKALDIGLVQQKKTRRLKLFKIRDDKLESLTDAQIATLNPRLPNGAIFINGTSGKLNYKFNDIIVSL